MFPKRKTSKPISASIDQEREYARREEVEIRRYVFFESAFFKYSND
jgi:hypothetical protein